ncbi:MAG: cell division protein FtsQ/DivIB [Gemmobacter sp.]|nr:cell division protein FtsQ/DivIB [Gemmobacter sp.]
MGERRWDIVLDRNQRILLPAKEPVRALERLLALDKAEDLLKRDIADCGSAPCRCGRPCDWHPDALREVAPRPRH